MTSEEPRKTSMKSRRSSVRSGKNLRQTFATMNEKSIGDLTAALSVKKKLGSEGVQWADDVESKHISVLRKSCIDDMFYTSTELSEFRYEAFMEDCGLDPNDYD